MHNAVLVMQMTCNGKRSPMVTLTGQNSLEQCRSRLLNVFRRVFVIGSQGKSNLRRFSPPLTSLNPIRVFQDKRAMKSKTQEYLSSYNA